MGRHVNHRHDPAPQITDAHHIARRTVDVGQLPHLHHFKHQSRVHAKRSITHRKPGDQHAVSIFAIVFHIMKIPFLFPCPAARRGC
jgi:hypothetical protein